MMPKSDKDLERIVRRIVKTRTDDFLKLASLAGLDPAIDLIGADLRSVDLRNSDLRDFNFSDCDLRNANLTEADLRKVNLTNADLQGANLRDANLEQARLDGAKLQGTDLRGALLVDVVIGEASLEGARIEGATLVRPAIGAQPSDEEFSARLRIVADREQVTKSFPGKITDQAIREKKVKRQTTLGSTIQCTGVGLHSGKEVTMTLHPASENTGVVFKRVDVGGQAGIVPAVWRNVKRTRRHLVLGNEDGVEVSTVDHLLAGLMGCGVDNVIVEVDGPEIPIMDGSAAPFVLLMECAGIIEQNANRRAIKVNNTVAVGDDLAMASLTPGHGFSMSFEIDYDHPIVGRDEWLVTVDEKSFKNEISRARSFIFLADVQKQLEEGFVLGGSLNNAIVLSSEEILNESGLRYPNEFVRSKVLAALGDISLAGAPVMGHFHGFRSGHALHHRLLEMLFSDQSAWCYVDAVDVSATLAIALQYREAAANIG